MVTIKDIAKAANVAVSTVSYALNNDPRIPDDTRHRIIETAQRLNYTGKSGKKNEAGYLRQVVLCLNSIKGEVYTEIVNSMKKVFSVNNCELFIYMGTAIDKLKLADGFVILNSQIETSTIENVLNRKTPVVVMDRKADIFDCVYVTLDNYTGVYNTTDAAIKKGAKTFAFVGGPKTSHESNERYEGFVKALSDSYLNRKDTIVLQSDFTYEGGKNVSHYLMGLAQLPDAIICANDEMAHGIISQLYSANPDKMPIVTGFDGFLPDAPTTYITARVDQAHWGSTAAYTIMRCFEKVKYERKVCLPTELIEQY